MDDQTSNASPNASRPQNKHLRPQPFKPGPADEVGRPRGGRKPGSVSLSAAYREALAQIPKGQRRAAADIIAANLLKLAGSKGKLSVQAAREIRQATEGDTLNAAVEVEVVYVNDWRAAEADSASAASWDASSAVERPAVQLGESRPTVAQNHNGNGAHR